MTAIPNFSVTLDTLGRELVVSLNEEDWESDEDRSVVFLLLKITTKPLLPTYYGHALTEAARTIIHDYLTHLVQTQEISKLTYQQASGAAYAKWQVTLCGMARRCADPVERFGSFRHNF